MNSSERKSIILTGIVIGALLGGVFAWLVSGRDQEDEQSSVLSLGPSEYFQLGIGVLTLARQFQAMLQKSREG